MNFLKIQYLVNPMYDRFIKKIKTYSSHSKFVLGMFRFRIQFVFKTK
jgi:hypothetical protein